MYSPRQIIKGIKHPEIAKREAQLKFVKATAYVPHDIGVHGSYNTGNIGDRAIGQSIKKQFSKQGYSVKKLPKYIEYSNAGIRVLGGGGVLHDWYGTEHLRTRLNYLSGRSAILGVGVPGFRTKEAKELIAEELQNVDLVTVRDEWSQKRLEKYYSGDVHVTACPALLHHDPNHSSSGKTGVNFRPWFHLDTDVMEYYFDYDKKIDYKRAKREYIKNAKYICDNISNPVFIPFKKKDEDFARQYLDIDILPYKFSVDRTLKRVSSVDQMVAMRYHSLVFAAICDTPVLAIAYEPKVSYLADRLGVCSYKPHEEISIDFEPIQNMRSIRNSSKDNFKLLQDTFKT